MPKKSRRAAKRHYSGDPRKRAAAVAEKSAVRPQRRGRTARTRTAAPVRVEPEAPPLRRSVVVGGALTALVALIAYIVTLDPSLPTGDSGELITAARVWGVAHPPGYPLYTMLGHVSMWLPFGSPALRMNLLSAVLDAAAVGVVFVLLYRLVEVTARDRSPGGQAWTPFAAAAVG